MLSPVLALPPLATPGGQGAFSATVGLPVILIAVVVLVVVAAVFFLRRRR